MPTTQTDPRITVERPTAERLQALGVKAWPIWTKERATFDWVYEAAETCDVLEGEVTVITDQGRVMMTPGHLVTFLKGLRWPPPFEFPSEDSFFTACLRDDIQVY